MENNSNGKFNWEFRRTVDKSYIYFCFKSPYAIGKQYKEKKLKVCEQNYKLIGIKRLSSGDYDTNKEGYNVFKKKKKEKKWCMLYQRSINLLHHTKCWRSLHIEKRRKQGTVVVSVCWRNPSSERPAD